jgi:membrane protein YdbS with pleckstrin-like domain
MEQKDISELLGVENSQQTENAPNPPEPQKYPALRTISWIFLFLAWITGFVTVIASLVVYNDAWEATPALIIFFSGVILVLSFTATSELIKVFIDIEYNTRKKQNT